MVICRLFLRVSHAPGTWGSICRNGRILFGGCSFITMYPCSINRPFFILEDHGRHLCDRGKIHGSRSKKSTIWYRVCIRRWRRPSRCHPRHIGLSDSAVHQTPEIPMGIHRSVRGLFLYSGNRQYDGTYCHRRSSYRHRLLNLLSLY